MPNENQPSPPVESNLLYIPAYGWRPSLPDFRDHIFAAEAHVDLAATPDQVDLSANILEVLNQLQLGSCTANAIAAILGYWEKVRGVEELIHPSRLMIYYNEREAEGTVGFDAGAAIRDGIQSVAKLGVCDESLWRYDIAQFKTKPPKEAYAAAKHFRAVSYDSVVQRQEQFEGALAGGWPLVGGASIYSSFESAAVAKTGNVPMPSFGDRKVGGHAFCIFGYNRMVRKFLGLNSWGPGWGRKGLFTIDYDYLLNTRLSADWWRIRAMTAASGDLLNAAGPGALAL